MPKNHLRSLKSLHTKVLIYYDIASIHRLRKAGGMCVWLLAFLNSISIIWLNNPIPFLRLNLEI